LIAHAATVALAMLVLAQLLNLVRLIRGPGITDRILALDTMYINTISLVVLIGVLRGGTAFFEASLVIALIGFVTTVAFSKFLLRGDIIE
jgi:multicomponent K+:H+ antiporter subunit F